VRSTAEEGAFLLWLLSFGQAKESNLPPGNPGLLPSHLIPTFAGMTANFPPYAMKHKYPLRIKILQYYPQASSRTYGAN